VKAPLVVERHRLAATLADPLKRSDRADLCLSLPSRVRRPDSDLAKLGQHVIVYVSGSLGHLSIVFFLPTQAAVFRQKAHWIRPLPLPLRDRDPAGLTEDAPVEGREGLEETGDRSEQVTEDLGRGQLVGLGTEAVIVGVGQSEVLTEELQ
jgi:hypothetical protein